MSEIKKGLVAIANEVLEDVKKEAEAVIRESERHAMEKLEKTMVEANAVYESILAESKGAIIGEQRKIEALGEVEIRNRLLQVKDTIVDSVFEEALGRLNEYAKTDEYHVCLQELLQEAAREVSSKKLVVFANLKDKEWLAEGNLENLSKKMRINMMLGGEAEDCIGGCKIQSLDGRIVFDNTFEARLKQARLMLQQEVTKILFETEK